VAQNYVEQTAWRLIRSIPEWKSLRYLELGCGDGHMLEQLVTFGVESVRGTTYRPTSVTEISSAIASRVDANVNLNEPLPYDDASFDVVLSVEVIEHLEGHRNFISEAARVLKPGGSLILTTPNLHRLGSRLRFLVSGCHHTKRELMPADMPLSQLSEYHQRCVDFPTLHYLLWASGLRVESVETSKIKWASRLGLALWGPVWFYTHRACLRTAEGEETIKARKDLRRWLLTPSLLLSEQLCFRAVKTGTGNRADAQTSSHVEIKNAEPAPAGL
jgi:2-polyprenyl-3-methyl-5-hydroxy-6-metoxy-1,4-benzoquinol methylase